MSTRADRARRARNRQIAAVITLVALVALIIGALAVSSPTSSSSSSTTTSTSPSSTTTTTSLDPSTFTADGQALYSLVQAGRAASYHVVFAVTQPDQTISQPILEEWRTRTQVRDDAMYTSQGQSFHGVNIGGATGSIGCQNSQQSAALTCTKTSSVPIGPDDDVMGTITSMLPSASVVEVDDTILDQPAKCYRVNGFDPATTTTAASSSTSAPATSNGELCLSATGAPLRLRANGIVEVATKLETSFDGSIFQPPAPVG